MKGVDRIPVLRGAAHRARRRTVLRTRVRRVEAAVRENRRLETEIEAHVDELERVLIGVLEARLGATSPQEHV